jgi:hypothetical protein
MDLTQRVPKLLYRATVGVQELLFDAVTLPTLAVVQPINAFLVLVTLIR